MNKINHKMRTQYITDTKGKKLGVILSLEDYQKMIEELEDLQDIRRYVEAKASKEPSIPIDDAFKMIESKRKAKR
ncbi:MAG: hypothetical protein WCL14_07540 [Bacteroidota bacterium]